MVEIKDHKNEIPRLVEQSRKLDGTEVTAGVHGKDDSFMAMIAQVHEFGVDIQVTEDMRGWFLAQGFPLSEDTEVIEIPSRSFVRPAADMLTRSLDAVVDAQMESLVFEQATAFEAASRVALHMRQQILDHLGKTGPPLSDMTKQMRRGGGSAQKLQDEGSLRQAVAGKVDGVEVER